MSVNAIAPIDLNNTAPVSDKTAAVSISAQKAKEASDVQQVEAPTVDSVEQTSDTQTLAQIKLALSKSSSSMSAQQIADKYGISIIEAQRLLQELAKNSSSSTFSLSV